MSSLFDGSWIPKLGALIALAGGAMAAAGKLTVGIIVLALGSALGLAFARQDNRSSEDVGARTPPAPSHVMPPPRPRERL